MPSCHPNDYKRGSSHINQDIEDIYASLDALVDETTQAFLTTLLQQSSLHTYRSFKQFQAYARTESKKNKKHCVFNKNQVLYIYDQLVDENTIVPCASFRKMLIKKPSKSHSGVLVITVLTSPYPEVDGKKQRFSCQWNCYYCPNEPNQPRSYLHDEPAVMRANHNQFDPILQFTDRATTLFKNGHPVDKIEILVLGGTWSSYPIVYRENFIRDIFYAANTFLQRHDKRRLRKSLQEEKHCNATSKHRIIGVTLETRPDCITTEELLHFRNVGCTRVQLGIQHTNNTILDKVNRQCSIELTKDAIRLLLNHGFKIDGHFMPQLPSATPDDDKTMFDTLLNDSNLQLDQWKIYPCEVTPWTVIQKWHEKGLYTPYTDEALIELLLWVKPKVHPWIRLNRIIRDIPSQYILGGVNNGNLRQVLEHELRKRNQHCKCIRCREIKQQTYTADDIVLVVRPYKASCGQEYFVSYETKTNQLLGFLRLRIPPKDNVECVYPQLQQCAFIRELHVYGKVVCKGTQDGASQHIGLGKKLLHHAERLVLQHQRHLVAVIAGVGTRHYYASHGYCLLDSENGEMMLKELHTIKNKRYMCRAGTVVACVALLFFLSLHGLQVLFTDICCKASYHSICFTRWEQ